MGYIDGETYTVTWKKYGERQNKTYNIEVVGGVFFVFFFIFVV